VWVAHALFITLTPLDNPDIPLVGSIWLLVVLATKGTEGDNQYGPDPNSEGPLFDFERAEASGT
jgi:Predicted membrane protein